MRAEEPYRAARRSLLVDLHDDAAHRPLVALARAVDVEELEPRPLPRRRRAVGDPARDAPVEKVLGATVGVERSQPGQRRDRAIVVEAGRAVAVGGRRGGVDQPPAVGRAPVPQRAREAHVLAAQQRGVGLGRGRHRPHVHDRLDVARPLVEEGQELLGRDRLGDAGFLEVAPLLARAHAVAHDDLAAAPGHERGDDVRADEAGAAGDDDHRRPAAAQPASRERVAVVECPGAMSASRTRPP